MNNSVNFLNATTNVWVALVLLPMVVVVLSWLDPQWQQWQHLLDTVFGEYVVNTLLLAFGVGILSAAFAVLPAWWISQYEFPMRRFFSWALLLPLAIPSYIAAYVYVGFIGYEGPLQQLLRELGINRHVSFPDIQNLAGTCVVMAMVLFPYVYGITQVSFSQQSGNYRRVAQSLGLSEQRYFFKLALPMAFPAILAGIALTMMEAMADFGTVEYMGVVTFTTGIFRTWFGMSNITAASQLASSLVIFVMFLLAMEKWSRRKQRFYSQGQDVKPVRLRLSKVKSVMIILSLCILLLVTFIVPLSVLIYWGNMSLSAGFDTRLYDHILNTFLVAGLATLVIIVGAILLTYLSRLQSNRWSTMKTQCVASGYAFPGTVIAVGCVMSLGWLDHRLNDLLIWLEFTPVGLVLSGTLFALVFAYTVRFSTVGLHYIQNGLDRIAPTLDNAARSLGSSQIKLLISVHLPLLRGSILMAGLVVFVDIIKELPATLILRPFNFDTLAVKTYELAKDERITDASVPALLIILISLLPVLVISKINNKT